MTARRWGCGMTSRSASTCQLGSGFLCLISGAADLQATRRMLKHAMPLAILVAALGVLASPQPAGAWRHGHAFNPANAGGYVGGPAPWVLFPYQRPRPDYRYSVPPGAPLSYDDPGSGTTYCWSQTTGFYFACAYGPPVAVSVAPIPPPPSAASLGEPATAPASGVLLFRLPRDAQAAIDGVPIGLSDGVGIHSLAPGAHRVVLHVSGKETAHTVNVRSHRIFTVTPAGIVATEP